LIFQSISGVLKRVIRHAKKSQTPAQLCSIMFRFTGEPYA
jgi:hypothetical protein